MYKLILGIAAGLLLFNSTAMAACSVPNTLTNGTTADATAVMGNFTSLAGCAAPLASPSLTGPVGINTASPGYTLDVQNTGAASVRIKSTSSSGAHLALDRVSNSLSYASQLSFFSAGNADFAMGTSQGGAASDALSIYDYGSASNVFTIVKSNGYIGIATVSPSYPLHVNGTAYATGAAGALSDIRHKRDVVALDDGALSDVLKLRPVTYFWREPKDGGMRGQQMGFIAQEVERTLPSVVLTEDNVEKTKGLKYNELIALLTKAMQEQQAQIKALTADYEHQVRELRAANNNDRREIELLRSSVGSLERSVRVRSAAR